MWLRTTGQVPRRTDMCHTASEVLADGLFSGRVAHPRHGLKKLARPDAPPDARAGILARAPRPCPARARPGPAPLPPPQRSPPPGNPDHLGHLAAAAAQRREAAAGALDRAAQAAACQRAVHSAGELLGRRVAAPGHLLARRRRRLS